MSIPSKTVGTSLVSMQAVTTGTMVVGSAVDVTDLFSALLSIKMGRTTTSALTVSPQFMVEWSAHASDDRSWFPLWNQWLTTDPALDLAAAEAEAVSGTVAAGATTIGLASTANLGVGEFVCLSNTTSSEIRRIKTLTFNTNITVDALVSAATGLTLYDGAQVIPVRLNLNEIKRIRGLVSGMGVGQTILAEMVINTLDSVG